MEDIFRGYCFFDNGRYNRPTYLEGFKKAILFLLEHKNNYPRVIVTDSSDSIVLESINHKITFPNELASLDDLSFVKLELTLTNELGNNDDNFLEPSVRS